MKAKIQPFRNWVGQLDFGDDETNQAAFSLQVITLIIIPIAALIGLLYAFLGRWDYVALTGGIVVSYSFTFWLMRYRHPKTASNLFLLFTLFLLMAGLLSQGGIHTVGAVLYPVILIFASLLLETPPFVAYCLLCVGSVGLMIYAENQRLIPIYAADPLDFSMFAAFSLMILGSALIIRFVTQSLKSNLRKARKAEQALKESERQIRLIADNIPGYVAYVDADRRYRFINQRYAESFGRSPEQIIGCQIQDVVGEAYYEANRNKIDAALSGQSINFEATLNIPLLGNRWISVSYLPDFDEQGMVKGLFVFVHDVTERKQAEETVFKANIQLEQRVTERTSALEAANRELESLSYTIGHDLRSPIRAAVAYSQMLSDELAVSLTPPQAEKLYRIYQVSSHMGKMVDDFLDFLRLSRKKLQKQALDINQLVQQVIKTVQPESSERQIEFAIGPLPTSVADEQLIRNLYFHLISNAVKFTAKAPVARIELGALDKQGETCYFVRDNGAGFDMQYADQMFGVFQRLHPQDEFESTGMGLAIAQRIVQRHDGRIWAEAKPGEGATFYFTLGES